MPPLNSRNVIAPLMVLFLSGVLSACKPISAPTDDSKPVPIGVIVPLSGPAANMGVSIERALNLLNADAIQLRFEDDQCSPKLALAAYQKLRREGVKLWYAACSGSVLALAPLLKKDGGLLVTGYAGSSAIRQTGNEVIRFNPDAKSIADQMAVYLKKSSPSMLGLMYEDQEYAHSVATLLKQKLGERVALKIGYQPLQPSYRAELLQFRKAGTETLIIVPVGDAAASLIYKELRELQFDPFLVGDVNLCDYKVKPSDYGLSGICWHAELQTDGYKNFLLNYQDRFKTAPDYPFYDALSFDALSILQKLIENEGMTAANLNVQRLTSLLLAGQVGRISSYSFEPNGEVVGAKYLVEKQFRH